jgi:hypothetical protein
MRVFICYRREDSQHQTGRLYDKLESEFGAENVFKDVDSVPVGSDFRLVLRSAIDRCDVVLAVIGDLWVDIADESGARRIDDPDDFVRIEIEWALKRNIAVVPVLVGNRSMPSRDELPKTR